MLGTRIIVTNEDKKPKKVRVTKEVKMKSEKNVSSRSASARASGEKGKEFEDFIWNNIIVIASLLIGVNPDNLINIDSKNKNNAYSKKRRELKNRFILLYGKMKDMKCTSAIRGDILLIENFKKIIIDIKDYFGIQSVMKFPSFIENHNFIKGIDSNLKYLFEYHLKDIFHPDLKILKDVAFEKDVKKFQYLKDKYKEQKTLCYISSEIFIKITHFMEIGYANQLDGVEPLKCFISKNKDILEYRIFDLNSVLTENEIRIDFSIDSETGYSYILFYEKNICVYIVSMRAEKENFIGNCSFINTDYIKIMNSIKISDL